MTIPELTPEQRLKNVASCVIEYTELDVTLYNGKGKNHGRKYVEDVNTIAPAARQLAEMVVKYLDGELDTIELDDLPF